jgi:hypothetical protein
MKNSIKQTLGAAALTAMALSVIGTGGVMAKGGKSAKMEPPPPSAERNKSSKMEPPTDSTVFDPCKNPRPNVQCDPRQGGSSAERNKSGTIKTDPVQGEAPPSAEKGIKDNAIKSCGNCGLTGRVAAPPATGGPGDTPPPSADYESPGGGQHLDKGRFPRTIHFVALVGGVAATGGILAASDRKVRPTSP